MCEWNRAAQPARRVGRPVGDCETAEVGSRHRHREREGEKEISLCLPPVHFMFDPLRSSSASLFINHARALVGPGATSDPCNLDKRYQAVPADIVLSSRNNERARGQAVQGHMHND